MPVSDVVVVGAGHAGLSVSRALRGRGIDHVVLERDRVAQAWRTRWDSFCLVTPNWSWNLPEGRYEGDDPDGFLPRDQIVARLERYAADGELPVREAVAVTALRAVGDGFALDTSEGEWRARAVVACSGAYQRPHRPAGADTLPAELVTIDAVDYRRPEELPAGGVLIVGSGQTGAQLAEELHADGRDVVLACGRAPWVARRLAGHDVVWWAVRSGFLDQPVSALPEPGARLWANILATGAGGGHDLHYRTLAAQGVTLVGRFQGVEDRQVRFADDLAASVAWGDERHAQFMRLAADYAAAEGLPFDVDTPSPFVADAPTRIPLDRVQSVLFTGGYRPDYGSWLPWPEAMDELGFPRQVDGVSSIVEGLFFCGVHFLRTRKSSILWGAAEDAGIVADAVADRVGAAPRADPSREPA